MKVLNHIDFEPYGYSHGDRIGFKLSGIKKGFEIDFAEIDRILNLRLGEKKYNTSRREGENFEVVSGISDNTTTGEMIEIIIRQDNFRKSDYQFGYVRPGHADLSAYQKYGQDYNYSGGGQFSGRLTALYVIAGEICHQVLQTKTDLEVLGHVASVGNIDDKQPTVAELRQVKNDPFPMVDSNRRKYAKSYLELLKSEGDSIGGALGITITNIRYPYGDDFFNGLEAKIAFMLYAIPAVKAIEFGLGHNFTTKRGSEIVEQLRAVEGHVVAETNYNGGINGGIANTASDIELRVTIKATSSIFKPLETVRYVDGQFESATLNLTGRHDAFIANRALWPLEGLLYILFLDLQLEEEWNN